MSTFVVAEVANAVTIQSLLDALPAGTNTIGGVTQSGGPWTQNLTHVGGAPISLGQAAAASSLSVVLASDQGPLAVTQSGTWNIANITGTISLPTGAATDATLATLLTEAAFTARINTLGQKTSANSTPVVLASDQSAIPVTGTVTANLGTVAGLALDATLTSGSQKTKITDGTNTATILPASTTVAGTDTAIVVAISPNSASITANDPSVGTVGATAPNKATEMAGVDAAGNLTPVLVDGFGRILVSPTSPGTKHILKLPNTGVSPYKTTLMSYAVPTGQSWQISLMYAGGNGSGVANVATHDTNATLLTTNGDFESSGQVSNWVVQTPAQFSATPDSSTLQSHTGTASMRWQYQNSNNANPPATVNTYSTPQDFSGYRYFYVYFYNDSTSGTTRTLTVTLTAGAASFTYNFAFVLPSGSLPANTWTALVCDLFNPDTTSGVMDLSSVTAVKLQLKDSTSQSGTVFWDTAQLKDQLTIKHSFFFNGTTESINFNPVETFNSDDQVYFWITNDCFRKQLFGGAIEGYLV